MLVTMGLLLSPDTFSQQADSGNHVNPDVELSTGVDGEVKEIFVKKGDYFKRGDLLLTLVEAPFRARIALIDADIGWLKGEMKEAEREYQRNQDLYEDGSLSTVDLELSRITFEKARAQYNKQQAHKVLEDYRLQQSRIVAPFDGEVLEVKSYVGQRVIVQLHTQALLIVTAKRRDE